MSPSALAPDLRELAGSVRPLALARERVLPVPPLLEPLFPERGLRRGSVVASVGRAGATSLALALISAASADGSWCAAVGVGRPRVGLAAAAELGVVLERFPVVSAADGNGPGGWAWVVAALLDAIDVVVAWPPAHVRATDARRLAARGRERGAVLVLAGAGESGGWPVPVDMEFRVAKVAWRGVGQGHGRLEARLVEVMAVGRGAAARERRADVWLPAPARAAESGKPARAAESGKPARADSVVCTQRAVKSTEMAEITTLRVQTMCG